MFSIKLFLFCIEIKHYFIDKIYYREIDDDNDNYGHNMFKIDGGKIKDWIEWVRRKIWKKYVINRLNQLIIIFCRRKKIKIKISKKKFFISNFLFQKCCEE